MSPLWGLYMQGSPLYTCGVPNVPICTEVSSAAAGVSSRTKHHEGSPARQHTPRYTPPAGRTPQDAAQQLLHLLCTNVSLGIVIMLSLLWVGTTLAGQAVPAAKDGESVWRSADVGRQKAVYCIDCRH